jgi:NAD(P)-dependent dehydrogenase (short-subunit alcohol dehydrogenase family)
MRVMVIGASGTIGKAVVAALGGRHEVVAVGNRSGKYTVDIADPASIRRLYAAVGPVDAVVCAAGLAAWKPLAELTDEDFAFSFGHKAMGQINIVRYGLEWVGERGSFTLTSGVLSTRPAPGSVAVSTINAAVEAFVRAAALELGTRRINAVSPGWVSETLQAMGQDPAHGTPAAEVAKRFVAAVEGSVTGTIIPAEGVA